MNVQLPLGFEVAWFLVVAVLVALAVSAMVSVFLNRSHFATSVLALWVLAIVVFPFVGSLVWFCLGRPKVAQRAST